MAQTSNGLLSVTTLQSAIPKQRLKNNLGYLQLSQGGPLLFSNLQRRNLLEHFNRNEWKDVDESMETDLENFLYIEENEVTHAEEITDITCQQSRFQTFSSNKKVNS